MGSGAGGAGYSSSSACDSLTCALIGSSRNLLSWIHCAGIGSSIDTPADRKRGREGGGQKLPCSTLRGNIERGGERAVKGEYPRFSSLCGCSPLPPHPSFCDFLPPSFPLLICFCGCTERKGTCRSLMIQPFS